MQQDEFDGFYSIDFEHEFSLNDFKDLLVENFPKTNIFIFSKSETETVEHFYDYKNLNIYINMSVEYLRTHGVYDFEDVKTRVGLDFAHGLQVSSWKIMDFLQEFSKKVNSKIYVFMECIGNISFSHSDYSFWCIDSEKRKIVFKSEQFLDNPKNVYQDFIPSKVNNVVLAYNSDTQATTIKAKP